jgi:hypothetical protein
VELSKKRIPAELSQSPTEILFVLAVAARVVTRRQAVDVHQAKHKSFGPEGRIAIKFRQILNAFTQLIEERFDENHFVRIGATQGTDSFLPTQHTDPHAGTPPHRTDPR